jgi:hypothetical protein
MRDAGCGWPWQQGPPTRRRSRPLPRWSPRGRHGSGEGAAARGRSQRGRRHAVDLSTGLRAGGKEGEGALQIRRQPLARIGRGSAATRSRISAESQHGVWEGGKEGEGTRRGDSQDAVDAASKEGEGARAVIAGCGGRGFDLSK